MRIAKLNYTLDSTNYMSVQYGFTSSSNKGRGSDSDWQTIGSTMKTDYGTMDFTGRQKPIDTWERSCKKQKQHPSLAWLAKAGYQ